MTNEEVLDAKKARELVANNEKRNKLIKKMIAETNKSIENACKDGERKSILHDKENWYDDTYYTEVHEHFRNLGYEIKRYYDGSGYYLTW